MNIFIFLISYGVIIGVVTFAIPMTRRIGTVVLTGSGTWHLHRTFWQTQIWYFMHGTSGWHPSNLRNRHAMQRHHLRNCNSVTGNTCQSACLSSVACTFGVYQKKPDTCQVDPGAFTDYHRIFLRELYSMISYFLIIGTYI